MNANNQTNLIREDPADDEGYLLQLEDILEKSRYILSDLTPSQWAERFRFMPKSVTAKSGTFSFDNAPYMREICDCFGPTHPAHTIAVMKAPQTAFTSSVVENVIGYKISQDPGNITYLVGHKYNLKDAMNRVEIMIDNSGLRPLIKSTTLRARANKTGDTDTRKDFLNGWLQLNITQEASLRAYSSPTMIVDDYEAMKIETKKAGSLTGVIQQRAAAYRQTRKICYSSSPLLKQTSNIEPVYMEGDQRKYHIPCPCCGQFITLEWEIDIDPATVPQRTDKEAKTKAGITYQLDEQNHLIPETVGYTCQKCLGFFTDAHKDELLRLGHWQPTARPSEAGYYSYHISALYAPTYMYDWAYYVNLYLKACPPGQEIDEAKLQTHYNTCLGLPYQPMGKAPKANQLQQNTRNYTPGTIPHALSIKDGNGPIVMLTCAVDMNGTIDDGRLDYEITGWSKAGPSYSIQQGSIGTFIPKENQMAIKTDRARLCYHHNRPNSVWPLLDLILDAYYPPDQQPQTHTDPGRMKIAITALDTGHFTTDYAYPYVDTRAAQFNIIGVKGKDEEKYTLVAKDQLTFTPAKERRNLYLLNVNQLKDSLANFINLFWDENNQATQPANFMNFPTPNAGQYQYKTYFAHFESEHRITKDDKDGNTAYMLWQKISSNHQNHFWDCRVYNLAARDILIHKITDAAGIKRGTWADFVDLMVQANVIN